MPEMEEIIKKTATIPGTADAGERITWLAIKIYATMHKKSSLL